MQDISRNITLPDELLKYYKSTNDNLISFDNFSLLKENDILQPDIRITQDENDANICLNYYHQNILQKVIYYKRDEICKIDYYKSGYLYNREEYYTGKLIKKTIYNRFGSVDSLYKYEYNKFGKVISIKKLKDNNNCYVNYGYDDFGRINARKIYIDNKCIKNQIYRYDILDRIVLYQDDFQRILVKEISKKNELIYYIITDRMGNEITIKNTYVYGEYLETKITLNEQSITVKNSYYADNIMLKKPYTTDDDLDLIISNLFQPLQSVKIERNSGQENHSINLINDNIKVRVLPISIRKRILYNLATGTEV